MKKEKIISILQRFVGIAGAFIFGMFYGMHYLSKNISNLTFVDESTSSFLLSIKILFIILLVLFISSMILINLDYLKNKKKSIFIKTVIQIVVIGFIIYELSNLYLYFINDAPIFPSIGSVFPT